jgi:hypothetical protein
MSSVAIVHNCAKKNGFGDRLQLLNYEPDFEMGLFYLLPV